MFITDVTDGRYQCLYSVAVGGPEPAEEDVVAFNYDDKSPFMHQYVTSLLNWDKRKLKEPLKNGNNVSLVSFSYFSTIIILGNYNSIITD